MCWLTSAKMEIGDKTTSGWEVVEYDDIRIYSMKHKAILTSDYLETLGYKKGTEVFVYTKLYTPHKYIEIDGKQHRIRDNEYKTI